MKKFLKTKKMFVSLLASYIAIFVFMSAFLFWMYFESDAKVEENLTEYNVASAERISEIIDNFCSELEMLSYQIKFLPLVDSVINGNEKFSGYSDYKGLLESIDKLNDKYNFIADVYLYIPGKDIVYSESAIVDSYSYFNKIRKYKNYDYNEWKQMYATGVNANRYFPVEEVAEYGIAETNVVTFSNSYFKKGTWQVAAYFNVLIDINEMMAYIGETQLLNKVKAFAVYDKDNKIVFKTNEEIPDDSLAAEHLENNLRFAELDNRSIFYVSSRTKMWKYSIVVDNNDFISEMSDFSKKLKIILIFNIIIGILMVILSLIRTYRPLKMIIADITQHEADSIINENYEIGEVEVIKTIFSEQKKTILEIEGVVIKQEQLIKENALKKILFTPTADSIDEEKSDNSELLEFNAEMFGVAVLLLREQQSDEFKKEMHLLEYAISNMFLDVLKDNYNINIIRVKNGELAIIANFERDRIKSWFKDLHFSGEYISKLMMEEYDTELFVGVGEMYCSLGEISKSFTEALSALNFRACDDETHVIIYKELLEQNAQFHYYPVGAENEIFNSVVAGDYSRVKMILEDINKTNDELEISNESRYRLNSELIACYQNVTTAYSIEPEFFTENDIKGNTSDIIKNIKNQYRKLCGGAGVTKFDKSEKLVAQIRNYVYEHFSESSLSLDEIADHIGITRQYLSTIYRSVTDEKLVDFITKVRVEKAKELLEISSLSIKQIAEEVGFTSDISFIRAFKRVEEITPGYYRDNL